MTRWPLEWRLLLRDRGAVLIVLGWMVLLAYASVTGILWVRQMRADQMLFLHTAATERAEERARIVAVESGSEPADAYVGFPSVLRSPVVLPVPPLAALDPGLLDRVNLNLRVSLFTTPQQSAKGRELQSPLLLTAGQMDLGYLSLVLMPLVLIGLLYAQPGSDRSLHRLPLLAQHRPLARLYAERHGLRVALVLIPWLLAVLICVALSSGAAALPAALLWCVPLVAWAILWSALCRWFATRTAQPGSALTWLAAVWVSLLWLLPAAMDTLIERLAPIPSALELLGAERTAVREAQQRRDELFGTFVGDHPELHIQTARDALAWTRTYYVQQRYVMEAMAPLRAQRVLLESAQQRLRRNLQWLSPAQALSATGAQLAGVDLARLHDFHAAAEVHKQTWDDQLYADLLAGTRLSSAALDRLPSFVATPIPLPIVPSVALTLILLLVSYGLIRISRWQVEPAED